MLKVFTNLKKVLGLFLKTFGRLTFYTKTSSKQSVCG